MSTITKLSPNYATAKLYYSLKNYLNDFLVYGFNLEHSREEIIVYQMGKVGSRTIVWSLKSLDLDLSIYHVHALSYEGIKRVEKVYRENFARTRIIHNHFLQSLYLRQRLDKSKKKKKLKVVTLVREPIARNISKFFQNLHLLMNYDLQDKINTMKTEDIVRELKQLFFEKFNSHYDFMYWFDRELKSVFELDVFAKSFSCSEGYKTYENEQIQLLLLRVEDLNNCAQKAFKEFLDLDDFNLVTANTGNNKEYKTIYQEFLKSINLPLSYMDKIYNSRYTKHFYSEEEIKRFRKKWQKNI
ncbi:putative capsular polysaccharide synthesis family protein [Pleurocapsa sp. PCC 7319]|uniref:putative capsular polysaccharide synthesis family protein n=1 Tax=Pleurocapsa sp. PCC 7319 TaxID=118161 RepID=UPI0003450184|nr:putative capsular polysaccharide synthesis family protein [Pleurocapsa sp. PCC 7319]